MRAPTILIIAVALALLAQVIPSAWAEPKPPTARTSGGSWQLLSGQDYLEMAEYDREVYVTGVNDAYNWSYVAGFERMKWLVPCVYGRKAQQLSAMFAKWLQENPERWHEPAAKLFPFAMFETCRKPKKEKKPEKKAEKKPKS
ncbi:MAG: hypothetical protein QF384_13775 [Alphaproteobacteria bacterium]|jgi:hypothetical protein|nr:hypothetical protein [Alphaproteobacteria bacterium]MDP6875334.1 hypothetical protein [Alphaproteobacteria bacterium]